MFVWSWRRRGTWYQGLECQNHMGRWFLYWEVAVTFQNKAGNTIILRLTYNGVGCAPLYAASNCKPYKRPKLSTNWCHEQHFQRIKSWCLEITNPTQIRPFFFFCWETCSGVVVYQGEGSGSFHLLMYHYENSWNYFTNTSIHCPISPILFNFS